MKRILLFVLILPVVAFSAITYEDTYYQKNVQYVGTGRDRDPIRLFINEAEGYLEGATGFGSVKLTPTDTVPTAAEGVVYWDDSENTLKGYNGSAWISFNAGAGDNTLDNAYDQGGGGAGRSITADTGAVAISNTDADTAFLVTLNASPSGAAALGGMEITVGGNSTENGIEFENSGSGDDVQGTGDTWAFTKAGAGTAASLTITGATGLVLENGAAITNSVDGAVKITEGGEDVSMTFNANTMTLSTSSAMDSIALGVVDDLEGVGSITMDAAAASMTLPSGGDAQDLTVSVTGATNSSLILSSSGTAEDALQITTTAGGINITNGGAAAGEDIDIDAVLASFNVNADEDVADAVTITTSAGGIDITADGGAASDLDLVCTNGSTNISGGEAIADAVTIAAGAGGVDISSAATFDIDVTATGGKVLVTGNEDAAGAVTLQTSGAGGTSETIVIVNDQGTGEDALNIDATAGGIDIDAATGKNIAVTGGQIILTSNENVASAISMTTNTGTSETIVVTNTLGTSESAITLTSTAGGINIDAATGKNIDIQGGQIILTSNEAVASAISMTTNTGAGETIVATNSQGTGEGAITLTSTAGGVDVDAAAAKNIDLAGGQVLISSKDNVASAIALTANVGTSETIVVTNTLGTDPAAINLTSTAGGITLTADAATGVGRITLASLVSLGAAATFTPADATPNISGSSYWESGGAVTITDFDAGGGTIPEGTVIIVQSLHAVTYDVTASGLTGGTADLVTASGDQTVWVYNAAGDWVLVSFTDQSDDLS